MFLIHLEGKTISNFKLNPTVSESAQPNKENVVFFKNVKYIYVKKYNNNSLYLTLCNNNTRNIRASGM